MDAVDVGVSVDLGRSVVDLGRLVDLAPDPIAVLRTDGTILRPNGALGLLMGTTPAALVGVDLLAECHHAEVGAARVALLGITEDTPRVGFRTWHPREGSDPAWVEWLVQTDPSTDLLYAIGRDVSHHVRRQAELEEAALTDSLTRLPNRAHILRRLGRMVAARHPVAVLFADLDGFKPINDRFGHGAGDTVLIEVATRIGRTTRAGEEAARIGGDEFVLLVPDPEGASPLANRLLEELAAPVEVAGTTVRVSASIGIAISEQGTVSAARLLHDADQALYEAKAEGGGTVAIRTLS